jgi:hypothetical protein
MNVAFLTTEKSSFENQTFRFLNSIVGESSGKLYVQLGDADTTTNICCFPIGFLQDIVGEEIMINLIDLVISQKESQRYSRS